MAAGLVAALLLGQRAAPLAGVGRDAMWNASLLAGFCGVASFRLLSVAMSASHLLGRLVSSSGSLWAVVLSVAVTIGAVSLRFRGQGVRVLQFLDASAPGLALLSACVSVGSFFGGRSGAPTRLAWGVADPNLGRVHPVEIYACLAALCLSLGLWRALVWSAMGGGQPGRVWFTGLFAAGGMAFFLDFTARPGVGSGEAVLDQVQWLALPMVVLGFLVLRQPALAKSLSRSGQETDKNAL